MVKGEIVEDLQITKILVSEEEVRQAVVRLGVEITAYYGRLDRELMVIGLLRGSFIFMADLVRRIKIPLVVDFMTVASYGDGTVSSGDVKVVMDLDSSIEGRDVLLVEDIVDTGRTFSKVIRMMRNRNPRSLKTCTFLNKPLARVVSQGVTGKEAWVTYKSSVPMAKAELNFTKDGGVWKERKWETLPAQLDSAKRRAAADIPEGARVFYLNLFDSRGAVVSTEHVEQ